MILESMADATAVPKGPPKFKPIRRAAVQYNPDVGPAQGDIAQDFTKFVPVPFAGVPPESLQVVAPLEQQRAQEVAVGLRDESVSGPEPAAVAVPLAALPEGAREATTVDGTGAPSLFDADAAGVAGVALPPGIMPGPHLPGGIVPLGISPAVAASTVAPPLPAVLRAAPVARTRGPTMIGPPPVRGGPRTVLPPGAMPLAPGAMPLAPGAMPLAPHDAGLAAGLPPGLVPAARPAAPMAAPQRKKPATAKVKDAAEAAAIEPSQADLFAHVAEAISLPPEPEQVAAPFFVPDNRRAFKPFVIQTFKKYMLPPIVGDPDPDSCMKAAVASTKDIKTFQYQAFIRDYLQRSSPYRGLLVYHGLGSGKTCTSIATAEALYGAGNRKIFIMTPASLSGNYRGEMTKCGFFAFSQDNYWTFVPATTRGVKGPELTFLMDTLGLPIEVIRKNKGGWVPDPTLPSNWDVLGGDLQAQITDQIKKHIATRFTFINYNGLTEKAIREWACKSPRMFDGAVVVIDEIHNLIRTINNSNLEHYYGKEPLQPEYDPKYCKTGTKYRIAYVVYRMLCNAVGLKIVALSGTPIINYPQELGIMANILSGDMRYATATLNPAVNLESLRQYLKRQPEVDLFDINAGDGAISIRMTPVASGYRKVIHPTTGEMRGFVRDEDMAAEGAEIRRERDLAAWMTRVEASLKTDTKAVGGIFSNITFGINQRLPDVEKEFVDTFIDPETLSLKKPNDLVLVARLSGLISYYKAGKPELVARVESDEVVEVEMSDRQLQQYTIVRNAEIKQEERDRKGKKKAAPAGARYAEVIKNQKGTFKIFSRAACNFVFPDDVPRPRPGHEDLAILELGEAKSFGSDGKGDVMAEAEQEETGEAKVDEAAEAAKTSTLADPYLEAIRAALRGLRGKGDEVFSAANLPTYSPKFQAIIDRLERARGPALLYSQFKTLEGLGLFGMALELQKNYIKFDIMQQANGLWALNPELLVEENVAKKRYIMYTGDEKAEKRDLLKHIFNANWAKVPKELAAAIRNMCGAEDNIQGKIAQIFMITQSGAEGISLENVRQVHLMEPYWNYVRLEQVKGRAIRICSHKMLPFAERTVQVYTYISKFSDRQKSTRLVDETLTIKDKALSTDQSIFGVSNDKKLLSESLFDAMKRAAVDCELNTTENGEPAVACYRFEVTPETYMIPIYHPKLADDITDSASSVRRIGAVTAKAPKPTAARAVTAKVPVAKAAAPAVKAPTKAAVAASKKK